MKRKAVVLAQVDKSTGIDVLHLTFMYKPYYGFTSLNYSIPCAGHSFICMYNDILYFAKSHDFKIDYDCDFNGRFYNIFWTFPERGVFNERYIICDNVREA